MSAALRPKIAPGPAPAQRRAPVARLAATTAAENAACARLSKGSPVTTSSRTASALIATSTAPEVAPSTSRYTESATGLSAKAGRRAETPKAATVIGVSLGPKRSIRTPVARIETSAPRPTRSSASPSSASLAPDRRCTAGSAAPQAPQKTPSAANPSRSRALRTPGSPDQHRCAQQRGLDERDRQTVQNRRPKRDSG